VSAIDGSLAQRAVIVAVALGALFGGCGGSGSAANEAASSSAVGARGLVRPGTPGAIAVEAGNAVPLGIRPSELIRRLGAPAVPLRRRDERYRCMFYYLIGQPPTVQLQYCFRQGELDVVATYIRER
jgi:hypothetical protein